MKSIILSRTELNAIADRVIHEPAYRPIQESLLQVFHTIGRMSQIMEMLKEDKGCFCSLPMAHTIACQKATECIDLLKA